MWPCVLQAAGRQRWGCCGRPGGGSPCLSPHSTASPAWPVLYKYSRLCLSAVLPSPYHKGAPDGATLGESAAQICWVRIPLLPPHLHMPVWASQILFQARGRKDALGPWMGLAALSGQWHWEATFYMMVASQACPGPFSFQGHPEPDMPTTACLSWGLKQDVSRFTIHRNCLGWI